MNPKGVILFPRPWSDPDPLTRWTLATIDRYARRWGLDVKTLSEPPPADANDATILAAMGEAARMEGYGLAGKAAPGYLWALPEHAPNGEKPLTVHVETIDHARELATAVYPELADPRILEAAVSGNYDPLPPPPAPSSEPWSNRFRADSCVATLTGVREFPPVGQGLGTCGACN